jgi:zinc protease
VLDHVLGEGPGFTDRLSKRIRDELGLCYSISCSMTANAGQEPGIFMATLSTSPANYKKAVSVLRDEIEKVSNSTIPEEELKLVKQYLIRSFIFHFEENAQLVGYLLKTHLFQLGFDYITRFSEIIQRVSAGDIQKTAQKYLHPEVATTVVVGSKKVGVGRYSKRLNSR